MTENPYVRWLKADFDLCHPVLDQTGLYAVLGQVHTQMSQAFGEGPKPSTFVDLEHLQVANYGAFGGVSEEQRQFMADLHAKRDSVGLTRIREILSLPRRLASVDTHDSEEYTSAHEETDNLRCDFTHNRHYRIESGSKRDTRSNQALSLHQHA